jgi:hypothetical protein
MRHALAISTTANSRESYRRAVRTEINHVAAILEVFTTTPDKLILACFHAELVENVASWRIKGVALTLHVVLEVVAITHGIIVVVLAPTWLCICGDHSVGRRHFGRCRAAPPTVRAGNKH